MPVWYVRQAKLMKVVSDDHIQTVRTVQDTTWDEVDRAYFQTFSRHSCCVRSARVQVQFEFNSNTPPQAARAPRPWLQSRACQRTR